MGEFEAFADPRILGQLLAAQSIFSVFSTRQRIDEFVDRAIEGIPGVESCAICMRDGGRPLFGGEPMPECADCGVPGEDADQARNRSCRLSGCTGFRVYPLRTQDRHFGFSIVKVKGPDQYIRYDPFISNLIDGLAVNLDRQWQKERLDEANQEMLIHRDHLRDLVEKRTAEIVSKESALRESEGLYRTLIDALPDAVTMTNLEGRVIFASSRALELHGFARVEEVLGKTLLELIAFEEREGALKNLQKTFTEGAVRDVEYTLLRKDGTRFPGELSAAMVRDAKGKPKGFIAITRDVSVQKQLAEQYRQLQKMDAVGRLAGGVAHDFNNALTVIGGYTEMLLGEMPANVSAHGKLETIRKGVEQASALTHQLLAFSRRQILQPRSLDLNGIIGEMRLMLVRLIGEDIAVEILPGEGLGRINADSGQIGQVIMNLVVNSRDAMPDGGKLVIETTNVELDEAYADSHVSVVPGSYVCLTVTDTGMGMDAATQERIFEPFFTTKEEGRGTGLGLPMVYGVVKQSGGSIWVYSEPGKGTTFKIYLPRMDMEAEAAEEPAVPTSRLQGSETILVAEDRDDVRGLVCEALKAKGYLVLAASNGKEARALYERQPEVVNLLLTDLVMPGMSGKELAAAIWRNHPAVKVIFMSGYTERATFQTSILGEGEAFIQKPFGPEALARKVREVLDSR